MPAQASAYHTDPYPELTIIEIKEEEKEEKAEGEEGDKKDGNSSQAG